MKSNELAPKYTILIALTMLILLIGVSFWMFPFNDVQMVILPIAFGIDAWMFVTGIRDARKNKK